MNSINNNINSIKSNSNKVLYKDNSTLQYKKNINLDYIFCFLKNFDISSAVWVLYMVYKGLPLWQIGIVECIFHVCSFLFEVPSGAVADLFGRKNTIIAGRILSIVSAVINLFAHNIFIFSLSFAISALSYNLNSGSEEALVYDSLKEINNENKYIKVNSRLNMIIEVAQSLGTFTGGILAEHSYTLCYAAVIFISLISLIPAVLFTEPSVVHNNTLNHHEHIDSSSLNTKLSINKTNINEQQNTLMFFLNKFICMFKNSLLGMHFKTCIKIIKSNAEIIKVLVYFPVIETFNTVVYFYGQQYFSILGFNKIEISMIMLFSGILCCLGALVSEKVILIFQNKAKYIASLLMAVSIIVLSIHNIFLSILFFGMMNFSNSILYPIQSTSLNELIPSNQRATIISISSMIFSLSMIIFFPLCGLIADIFNLHFTFMILGLTQLFLIGFLAKTIK